MKRASYRAAITWIVTNDDCEWAHDDDPIISVSAALVSDLFDVPDQKVISDIRRVMEQGRRLK